MTTFIRVTSGEVSSGLIIGSGTELLVSSGGTVSGFIVSGGIANVYAGGVLSSGTVEFGAGTSGVVNVYGGSVSGGSANNFLILSGGEVVVGNGGVATISNTTVASGGTLNIDYDGTGYSAIVSGGIENLYGGTTYYDLVESGGDVGVTTGPSITYDGQMIDPTVDNGGNVNVYPALGPYIFKLEGGTLNSGGVIHSGAGATVQLTTSAGGTILPLCFAAGANILTERGPVAVEDLVVGERVAAYFAGMAPIVWIGQRTIDCRRHARPEGVWPVRVRAGAFGVGVPVRDVLLSPDHAVFVADVLVPVRELVDGGMIVQERVDSVQYFHIELKQHDVLFAEGLPAESYLDTGNRANFQGEAGVIKLHPEFAALAWDALGCAPLVLAGPELEAARLMVVRVDEPEWAQGIAATA
jgi:autotransporter passenger strand-loop-strand repeat protein